MAEREPVFEARASLHEIAGYCRRHEDMLIRRFGDLLYDAGRIADEVRQGDLAGTKSHGVLAALTHMEALEADLRVLGEAAEQYRAAALRALHEFVPEPDGYDEPARQSRD